MIAKKSRNRLHNPLLGNFTSILDIFSKTLKIFFKKYFFYIVINSYIEKFMH